MTKKPLHTLFAAMYHGKYDFNDFISGDISSDYTIFTVRNRTIINPNRKLKTYQSFLNLFLFENLKVNNNVVFSYRKGVNAYDAVIKHSNSSFFFQTDIVEFFKNIDLQLVRQTINRSIDFVPITDIDVYLDRILEITTVSGSLPMGYPTSPVISNACLYDFDNKLESYCKNNGLIYTRYSDDIIISASKKKCLAEIENIVSSFLENDFNGRFLINRKKSKFTNVGNKIKLLGMVILPNGKVTVDIKFKNSLEVMLYFYMTDKKKFLSKIDGDLNDGIEKITGYLNYINTIDKSYLDKLRKKYGATIVDTFLHSAKKKK